MTSNGPGRGNPFWKGCPSDFPTHTLNTKRGAKTRNQAFFTQSFLHYIDLRGGKKGTHTKKAFCALVTSPPSVLKEPGLSPRPLSICCAAGSSGDMQR